MPTPVTRRILCIGSILIALATVAQSATRFDVASVKVNRRAACQGRWEFNTSHGRLNAENAPLLRIISRAYNLSDDRVSGPGWLDSQCYDIRAKAPGNTPDRDMMAMLRTLLQERFHLAAHTESAERPISVLVIDKGGSKLRPYGDPSVPTPSSEGSVLFMARHLPDLCERLGKVTGRPVVDKTGLDGDYLIVLTYPAADSGGDIFSALREQLGMRLESERGVVDILKIDSVDKVPTAN